MKDMFYKVEFDPSYFGGDYSGTGCFVLVPEDLVEKVGMDVAFEKTTGHAHANIVHYSADDRFNAAGELYVIEKAEAQPIEKPEPVVIEKAEPMKIELPEPFTWPMRKSELQDVDIPKGDWAIKVED